MSIERGEARLPDQSDQRFLRRVQKRRKVWLRGAVLAGAIGLLFLRSTLAQDQPAYQILRYVGLALIALCILGRAWCTLYIGGRKTNELVELGPYSVSRNPLYLFSFVGIAGLGLQSGSVVISALLAVIAFAVFLPVIRQEESVLDRRFPNAFFDY
jgi:protein-S-isoprenylcysteine O-methyltransferase Ste14